MVMPYKFRRAMGIAIPLFTGLLFLGVIPGIFGINISDNIFQTGVTIGFIFGILNIIESWWAYKHRLP